MQIEYNDQMIEMDSEWSHRDLTHCSSFLIPNDINIYGTCFACQSPTRVFLETMRGVTFYHCNLDNCHIPEGNTLIGCSNRMFAPQADGTDWLVDEAGNPLSPLDPPKD